jgi:hypothetical protein
MAKILRVKMPVMDAVLQAIPDLHVIHYFRDPRAVFLSRDEGKTRNCQGSGEKFCFAFVETLCREMAEDIKLSAPLKSKYPKSFMTLRYEDLVHNPSKALQEVYDFMGERLEEKLVKWINSTIMNAISNDGAHGIKRKDGVSHADKWRKTFRATFIEKSNDIPECKRVAL